ncbi:MAG: AsmA-like C-terminal region-containing protein [Vampirovibrio sp.]
MTSRPLSINLMKKAFSIGVIRLWRIFWHLPKGVLVTLGVWLGLVAFVNVGLLFWDPLPVALPVLNQWFEQKHQSHLELQGLRVFVLPWGTVLTKARQLKWQSTTQQAKVPNWQIQAEGATVPLHVWRFFLGGPTALLGTFHVKQVTANSQGNEGLRAFKSVLDTFKSKPESNPSPLGEHIKVHLDGATVTIEDLAGNRLLRPNTYELGLEKTEVNWHRTPQRLRVGMQHWRVKTPDAQRAFSVGKPAVFRTLVSGTAKGDLYLGPWIKAFHVEAHRPPDASLFWKALHESGWLDVSLNTGAWSSLFVKKPLLASPYIQPALRMSWRGSPLFYESALAIEGHLMPQKEAHLQVLAQWMPPAKGTPLGGLQLTKIQLTHPQGALSLNGNIAPQWTNPTPLKEAFKRLAWQLSGNFDLQAQSTLNALQKELARQGLSWQAGHLQAKLDLKGLGVQASTSQMKFKTVEPLQVVFSKAIRMGTVTFPKATQVQGLEVEGDVTPEQVAWRQAKTDLRVAMDAPPVRLNSEGVFHFKNQTIHLQADSPVLTAPHLSAFLRRNPHLVPPPYFALLAQPSWKGGAFQPHYQQDTAKDTLLLHTDIKAMFPHPERGESLPLKLEGHLKLYNTPQDHLLVVGDSLKEQMAKIQVGNQAPIEGNYLIHLLNEAQEIRLHCPSQALEPVLAWVNHLGVTLPQVAKPKDTLGVKHIKLFLNKTTPRLLELKEAVLNLGELGQMKASALCQSQCDWQSDGHLDLPQVFKRLGVSVPKVSVLKGKAHWQLHGQSHAQKGTLQALLGDLQVDDLRLRYLQHPQLIQSPRIALHAKGSSWLLDPNILDWGPFHATFQGQGTQGIGAGHSSHLSLRLKSLFLKNIFFTPGDEMQFAFQDATAYETQQAQRWQAWWKGLKVQLPERVNPTGQMDLDLRLDDGKPTAQFALNQVGGYFPTLAPEPFSRVTGTFEYGEGNRIRLTEAGLKGYYGLSPWDATNLKMTATPAGVVIDGRFVLDLHPRELNRFMALSAQTQMTHYNLSTHAVMDAALNLPQWNLTHPHSSGKARLSVDVEPIQEATPVPLEAPAPFLKSVSSLRMDHGDWELEQGEIYPLGMKNPIYIQASLDAPEAIRHLFSSHARIWTPQPLQLKQLQYNQQSPYSTGEVFTDLAWTSANGAPVGSIVFKGIESPLLNVGDLTGKVTLAEDHAGIHLQSFKTQQGSTVNWKAEMSLPQALPFQFKESHVHSAYWDLNDLSSSLNKQVTFWLAPFKEGEAEVAQWLPQYRVTYPFELRNSLLTWDMGVFQNIAVQDGQGLINLYQNGVLQLEDTRFKIVEGDLLMALTMDPFNNNATSLKLQAQNVPANPVFYGLTGVQQLVIGKLNGGFELGTSGSTPDDFLRNASGKSSLTISEGRMPELVTVENILSKVSIVRGGLLNLDLSDVGTFLKRVDKNSPAISETYQADVQVVNGLLLTNYFVTAGERMNLNVKGSLNLLSQQSHMMIRADILTNQKGLSPSQLNIRKILRYLPIIGHLPHRSYGLIDYIPVVGYIPAFGFNTQDTNMFYVRVNGKLDNPKDFELPQWVNGAEHFKKWSYNLKDRPLSPEGLPK